MLKTPQNLTVPLRTYRKRSIKELVHFSWSITKKLPYASMEHRKYGMSWSYRGKGMSHFLHIGLRVYHKVIAGRSAGEETLTEQDVFMFDAEWGLNLSVDLQGEACMGLCLQHT